MTSPFHEDAFLSAIAAAGLAPVKQLSLADGKIVRYRVEGDKAGSRNGWAVSPTGTLEPVDDRHNGATL